MERGDGKIQNLDQEKDPKKIQGLSGTSGKTWWCKTILVVYGLTPRGPLAEFSFTREFSRVTTINDVPARTARIIL